MPADSERIEEGLSRRQLLARGAVAAGVVWAAPVIRTASAYATSAAGTERPCTTFYVVCVDPLGVRPVRFPAGGDGYDEPPDIVAAALPSTTSTSTTTSTSSTTSTSTTSTSTSTSTTTTTTTPPAPTGGPAGSDPAAAARAANAAAEQAAATTTTTQGVDDFGLFPTTTTTTTPAAGAAAAVAPVDPHDASLAAAQGAAEAGAPDNIPPGIKTWLRDNPDVPVKYPDVPPMLTQTDDDAWAVTLAAVDGPDPLTHQCRAVQGWAQCKGKYAEYFVDPNPPDPNDAGRRLIFPNPLADQLDKDPTDLIESLIFVYCCP